MKHLLRAITLAAIALISGCASFPQNKLALANLPNSGQIASKPSASVQVRMFRGEATVANAMELTPNMPGVGPMLAAAQTAVEDSGLFRKVSFDHSTGSDLQLNLRIYNHGNAGLAAVAGLLTGFTFGVIPCAATDNYTLKLDVLDRNGQLLTSKSNEDAIRTYFGLIFLPMMGNTPKEALNETLTNQVRDALKQAYRAGKFNVANLPTTGNSGLAAQGF